MKDTLQNDDGKPNIDRIYDEFPLHGHGQIDHITREGHVFTFEFYQATGGYDATILSQPGYGNRSNGLHETHRLPGPNGYAKICFANKPQDLPTTIALAIWWAECTSKYIRTGGNWR